MANPKVLKWTQPASNTDGSPFDAAQFAGFELEINGSGAVSVPVSYATSGLYEMPLTDLVAVQKTGSYTLRMRTVNKAGAASVFSAPVTFSMDFRVPTAPTGLSVG